MNKKVDLKLCIVGVVDYFKIYMKMIKPDF